MLEARQNLTIKTIYFEDLRGSQEDAALLLRKLLKHICEETDPNVNLKDLLEISVTHQPVFDTADGSCCTCGYISTPQKDSRNILALSGNSGLSSLQGLLDSYFEDEEIELRCSNEGQCQDADSRLICPGKMRQIPTMIPKVLFIQVPKTINPCVNKGGFCIQKLKFEIVGVDHCGDDVNQGHYVAWTKHDRQ